MYSTYIYEFLNSSEKQKYASNPHIPKELKSFFQLYFDGYNVTPDIYGMFLRTIKLGVNESELCDFIIIILCKLIESTNTKTIQYHPTTIFHILPYCRKIYKCKKNSTINTYSINIYEYFTKWFNSQTELFRIEITKCVLKDTQDSVLYHILLQEDMNLLHILLKYMVYHDNSNTLLLQIINGNTPHYSFMRHILSELIKNHITIFTNKTFITLQGISSMQILMGILTELTEHLLRRSKYYGPLITPTIEIIEQLLSFQNISYQCISYNSSMNPPILLPLVITPEQMNIFNTLDDYHIDVLLRVTEYHLCNFIILDRAYSLSKNVYGSLAYKNDDIYFYMQFIEYLGIPLSKLQSIYNYSSNNVIKVRIKTILDLFLTNR